MGDERLDIEGLVAELEQEAQVLRARLGPSSVPELHDPKIGLRASHESSPSVLSAHENRLATLRRLHELSDPRGGRLASHRQRLGPAILAIKRSLIRLLTPIWNQQSAFNGKAVDALSEVCEGLSRHSSLLQSLDRRLLSVEDALARAPGSSGWGELGFDYQAFEERFRGEARHVSSAQRRYLAYFPDPSAGPVLDLGCGRGEFLALLREQGVAAYGVDHDAQAVRQAASAGLDAREGDLVDGLEACVDASLGGVVCLQVLEHLSLPIVLRILSLARQKLRPGGCFVAETVNLQSLIVHTRGWTIDPTHRQPLHPLTLRFLVDRIGFSRSQLVYSGEVDHDDRLETPVNDELGQRNISRLNALLFGPQDYAVVAWA